MKIMMIILFIFLMNIPIIYARGNIENNPNEIFSYYLELINSGKIKPLSMLESINIYVYNEIISYIPDNESIENYYYEISLLLPAEGNTIIYFHIWYYELFFNKYNGIRGDPTGRCFTIKYNLNFEFIRMYFWR